MINVFFFISIFFSSLFNQNSVDSLKTNHQNDSLRTITLSFVGDIMCHLPQIESARINTDSFDFKPVFREIKKYLTKADLTFGNLETVIYGKEKELSGYPLFNSPTELLDAVKDAGFDFLFTANNHCLDKGTRGIENTIKQIEMRELKHYGTFLREEEKNTPLLISTNGFRIGIISYTYGINGNELPKEKNFMVSLIDTNQMKLDILKHQQQDPDFILVYFHFGDEYSRAPSSYQNEIIKKALEYGADIIIGSHPHVIQKYELIQKSNGKLEQGFVAYSLGNFISNQRWRYSDAGIILNMELTKHLYKDSVWISKYDFNPTWVFKGETEKGIEFIILPSDTTLLKPLPYYLTDDDYKKLLQSYSDTKFILNQKN